MAQDQTKAEAASATLYTRVRDMAISFAFTPGQRIIEGELAQKLNVSRTPLREVMQQLVAEKLLRKEHNRGFFCRDLNEKDVQDLYEFRGMLECQAARLACERASDEALQNLATQIAHYEALSDEEPVEQLLKLDQEIHEAVAVMAGNGELLEALRKVNQRIYFFRWVDMTGRRNSAEHGHKLIVQALLQRDPDLASAAMSAHVRQRSSEIAEFIRHCYGMIYTGQTPDIGKD